MDFSQFSNHNHLLRLQPEILGNFCLVYFCSPHVSVFVHLTSVVSQSHQLNIPFNRINLQLFWHIGIYSALWHITFTYVEYEILPSHQEIRQIIGIRTAVHWFLCIRGLDAWLIGEGNKSISYLRLSMVYIFCIYLEYSTTVNELYSFLSNDFISFKKSTCLVVSQTINLNTISNQVQKF